MRVCTHLSATTLTLTGKVNGIDFPVRMRFSAGKSQVHSDVDVL